LAAPTDDTDVHEIQLNGKQLVFLFMAATVVSVVIFLCGVLVGRGVRTERGASSDVASNGVAIDPQPPAQVAVPTPAQPDSDPRKAEPPTPPAEAVSTASAPDKPNTEKPSAEKPSTEKSSTDKTSTDKTSTDKTSTDKTSTDKTSIEKPSAEKPAIPADPPKAPEKVAVAPGAEPQGPGYVVQVAALNVRSEADAIAKRLASKGYGAYVLPSASGTPQVFRVRIGKFGSRREAETMATRLQKEEQFKPWVTR
jgi:cell division septation protein DedD